MIWKSVLVLPGICWILACQCAVWVWQHMVEHLAQCLLHCGGLSECWLKEWRVGRERNHSLKHALSGTSSCCMVQRIQFWKHDLITSPVLSCTDTPGFDGLVPREKKKKKKLFWRNVLAALALPAQSNGMYSWQDVHSIGLKATYQIVTTSPKLRT